MDEAVRPGVDAGLGGHFSVAATLGCKALIDGFQYVPHGHAEILDIGSTQVNQLHGLTPCSLASSGLHAPTFLSGTARGLQRNCLWCLLDQVLANTRVGPS